MRSEGDYSAQNGKSLETCVQEWYDSVNVFKGSFRLLGEEWVVSGGMAEGKLVRGPEH